MKAEKFDEVVIKVYVYNNGFYLCSLCLLAQFLGFIFPWLLEKRKKVLTLILKSRRTKKVSLSPAMAGTRLACRAGEKSHLRVYTRDMFLQRFYGLKRQKFSWSLLARHLYARLTCESQTAYFLGCCQKRNEKTTSSLDRSLHPATCRLLLFLYRYATTNNAKRSS